MLFRSTTGISVSGISGNGSITLTNGNGVAITMTLTGSVTVPTYSGTIDGKGSLVMNGSGRQILSGTNSYEGTTTINYGVLQFGKAASLYNADTSKWTSSYINVALGATLGVNYGGGGEFSATNISLLMTQLGASSGGLSTGAYIGFDVSNGASSAATFSNTIADTYSATHALGVNIISGTLTRSEEHTSELQSH